MNVLSLFDGISTGRYCLDQAGIYVDNYFSSEIETNAERISLKNYPDIIRLGDVNLLDVKRLPKIDLIIGGSPCQGFSTNGKGLNFSDPRSKLFFNYVNVLNELKEINPDIKFLLENVRMKKEYSQIITEYMGVEPDNVNSRVLSPQNRERLYWTNISYDNIPIKDVPLKSILETVDTSNYIEYEGILVDPRISENCRSLISVVNGEVRIKQATKIGYIVAEDGDGFNLTFPTSKNRRGRVIRQKSPTLDCHSDVGVYYDGIMRYFTITELERLQTLPDGYTECEGVGLSSRKQSIGNGWTADVITHMFKGLKV